MPEITVINIGLLGLLLAIGLLLGWILRGNRCAREKTAVNAGWQAQMDSQQSEHDRLAGQNKSLMEQISQYQASNKDSNMRAKELSDSLRETFERRDQLQRQIKEIRSKLEVAVAQRDRLQNDVQHRDVQGQAADSLLKEKDGKIQRLNHELRSWQDRVAPLVERFREREQQSKLLEEELAQAREQIEALESTPGPEQTRIEPVDSNSLPDGLDASNEPHIVTAEHNVGDLQDQIADSLDEETRLQHAAESHESNADEEEVAFDDPRNEDPDQGSDDEPNLAAVAETDIAEAGINWWDELDDTDDQADSEPADQADNDTVVQTTAEYVSSDNPAAADARDDLKQIKGVGPAIEKTLNDLGIHRFNQIAEMSEYDIDRVAQHLRGFRSRIYREDWIGQARTLQYQKNIDHN